MANNFSGDANCKALWRLESGALTIDSKGSNTLTDHNTVQEDTVDYQEGSCCADLEKDNSEYFSIADGDLDAGFPLKNGDATKKLSFCGWLKPETAGADRYLVAKYDTTGKRSFAVVIDSKHLQAFCGYNSGDSYEEILTPFKIENDEWYHIGVTVDGVAKRLYFRLYRASNGSVKDFATEFSNELTVEDADFTIGGRANYSSSYAYDGKLDEVVIFNDLLSAWEIDAIRAGNYPVTGNEVRVSQVLAQVEYVRLPEGSYAYTGSIDLTLTPQASTSQHFTYSGNIGAALNVGAENYFYQAPGEYVYVGDIDAVFTPSGDVNIVKAYFGNVGVSFTPSVSVVRDRFYTGDINVELLPEGIYNVPIPGFDYDTGWGIVDFSFLSGNPPYWSVRGDVTLAIDPSAAEACIYAEYNLVAVGGLVLGGAGTVAVERPDTLEVVATGGVRIRSASVISFEAPAVTAIVATGQFVIAGEGEFEFLGEDVVPGVEEHVGTGGVALSSTSTISFITPDILALTGAVAVKAGGFSIPEVTVTRPEEAVSPSAGPVAVEIGGEGLVTFSEIQVLLSMVASGGICVGGEGGSTFISPRELNIIGEGGVALEDADEPAESCETWVLTGYSHEPSIYSGFDFNSYTENRGRYYAAKNDGIYLLEGSDDDGEPIQDGVRIGPTNFGVENQKRLRSIYLGNCGGEPEVRVSSGEQSECYLPSSGKATVSRSIQGQEFTIEIAKFDQLNHLEIIPLVLAKR